MTTGDRGFDPLGLAKPQEYLQFDNDKLDQNKAVNKAGAVLGKFTPGVNSGNDTLAPYDDVFGLERFRETELIHGRWAMLATLGVLIGEASTGVSWSVLHHSIHGISYLYTLQCMLMALLLSACDHRCHQLLAHMLSFAVSPCLCTIFQPSNHGTLLTPPVDTPCCGRQNYTEQLVYKSFCANYTLPCTKTGQFFMGHPQARLHFRVSGSYLSRLGALA